jgi:ribosomal protein S10
MSHPDACGEARCILQRQLPTAVPPGNFQEVHKMISGEAGPVPPPVGLADNSEHFQILRSVTVEKKRQNRCFTQVRNEKRTIGIGSLQPE